MKSQRSSGTPSRSQELWIVNGVLMTQNSKRQALRANLRIVDGRIVAITKSGPRKGAGRAGGVAGSGRSGSSSRTAMAAGRSPLVFDAQGLTLLPGFVQAHTHLCQTLFRNQADDLELLDWLSKRIWVMEAAHSFDTLGVSARLGIHELLSSGTTTILDMGTVRHTEAILEAVRATGIRASVGKCLMDHPETTPKSLRESTHDAIFEARSLYEKWHGQENDRIRMSYAPRFVISCTEKLLREVGDLAKRQGALIHTHASENLKEIQLVKKLVNCENVEYLHQLGLTSPHLVLAHCIWLKPNEKNILEKSGTHVVHCPSSNMKLASGFAHVPQLRARGVNVALGADGAPCNNNLDMFGEMRMAALIHKPANGPRSMGALDVLDMATRDGARALDWFKDIGSIEVGKKADLVALNLRNPSNTLASGDELNPEAIASSVVYSSRPSDVVATWVDGKELYRSGKVKTIPRDELMRDVDRAQKAIFKKIR